MCESGRLGTQNAPVGRGSTCWLRTQVVSFSRDDRSFNLYFCTIHAVLGENFVELNLREFCADLVEHEQQKSLQLATQSCPPIANGEV
jgi:hypothetical protein